eukprot:387107_1
MTAVKKANQWIDLEQCYPPNNITSINAHEFIISTWGGDKQLFKYNIDTNTFNELPIGDHNWYCGNMDFNDKEQIVYIQNGNKIISINIGYWDF